MSISRWPAFGLLALLYVLHNDWWLWSDRSLVAGLPVGLAYHVVYMIVTAGALAFLVRSAWPSHLDVEDDQ
jgi:hypothetical protein